MALIARDPNADRRPFETADFLLGECRERGEAISNLKLQKLLYYAEAWSLALFDRSLFDEDFRAWVHGPVLLSQYHRFKDFKWQPITAAVDIPAFDEALTTHLNEIVDVFGSEPAVALELMTHRERPWIEARDGLAPTAPGSAIISKATMRDFYRSLH